VVVGLATALALGGCVTVAEFRKLEDRVLAMQREAPGGAASRAQVADLMAEIDSLRQEVRSLQGRVEVAEHEAERAREEARRAREEAVRRAAPAGTPPGAPGAAGAGSPVAAAGAAGPAEGSSPPGAPAAGPEGTREAAAEPGAGAGELAAFREAYAAWRADDLDACIDRFAAFLQTYPTSPYADDATYWMGDCYFKKGDYRYAVLRFDDVVTRYPEGNMAPEALYRQGESLLRLGPRYTQAARRAFERVLEEYPESPRASAAREQLEALGPGQAAAGPVPHVR